MDFTPWVNDSKRLLDVHTLPKGVYTPYKVPPPLKTSLPGTHILAGPDVWLFVAVSVSV